MDEGLRCLAFLIGEARRSAGTKSTDHFFERRKEVFSSPIPPASDTLAIINYPTTRLAGLASTSSPGCNKSQS